MPAGTYASIVYYNFWRYEKIFKNSFGHYNLGFCGAAWLSAIKSELYNIQKMTFPKWSIIGTVQKFRKQLQYFNVCKNFFYDLIGTSRLQFNIFIQLIFLLCIIPHATKWLIVFIRWMRKAFCFPLLLSNNWRDICIL